MFDISKWHKIETAELPLCQYRVQHTYQLEHLGAMGFGVFWGWVVVKKVSVL